LRSDCSDAEEMDGLPEVGFQVEVEYGKGAGEFKVRK
jgi:hypothetical protein